MTATLEAGSRLNGHAYLEKARTKKAKTQATPRNKSLRTVAGSRIHACLLNMVQAKWTHKSVPAFGVIFTAVLSAFLNGYANSQHAPEPMLGWIMGLSVPVIVLILGKVAGDKYKRAHWPETAVTATAGIALLLLSVWHCSSSVARLCGCDFYLAIPMAIAIDLGLIGCEASLLRD
jgi:hypothetical protein